MAGPSGTISKKRKSGTSLVGSPSKKHKSKELISESDSDSVDAMGKQAYLTPETLEIKRRTKQMAEVFRKEQQKAEKQAAESATVMEEYRGKFPSSDEDVRNL